MKSKKELLKDGHILHIRVGEKIHEKFSKLCKESKMTMSDALRILFKQAVSKNNILLSDDACTIEEYKKLGDSIFSLSHSCKDKKSLYKSIIYINEIYGNAEIIKVKEQDTGIVNDYIHTIAYKVKSEIYIRQFSKGIKYGCNILCVKDMNELEEYFKNLK